ncbi:MAG: hypothetical protein SFY66_00775 [Oculatellaceae cyanobacterium bins.114]|nr:hypothetical protein [Oculatellaceae cyanobacterium bins.114]
MLNGQQIPAKLRRRISRELEDGEFIKWIEQPLPRFFTLQSLTYFFFGIPWTAFAIFWMYGAVGFKISALHEGIKFEHLFALFGVPFVLIGFWMLISPLREWLKAFRTVYLITDKRAISIESGWFTTIRNYAPAQLKDLYRKERGNDTGDVVITTRLHRSSEGNSWTEEIGFLNVRNPREVERLLQQLAHTEA